MRVTSKHLALSYCLFLLHDRPCRGRGYLKVLLHGLGEGGRHRTCAVCASQCESRAMTTKWQVAEPKEVSARTSLAIGGPDLLI